jgi:hypothetical protein
MLRSVRRRPSLLGASVLVASLAAGAAWANAPKTNYVIDGFTEETGSDLGVGNYQSSTSDHGKQCKATFTVHEGRTFSITKTTLKGPNAKPKQVAAKNPGGTAGRATPGAQSDGSGWQATSNAFNGAANHDGRWSVIVAYPDGAKGGCASLDRAVRVVFEASH